MSTAERIRLPDDCTIGYIVEALLGVPLIRSGLFHSHLENLQQVPASELHEQVGRPLGPGRDWLSTRRCVGRGGGTGGVTVDPMPWGVEVPPRAWSPRCLHEGTYRRAFWVPLGLHGWGVQSGRP